MNNPRWMCYTQIKKPINPNPRRGSLLMGDYTSEIARGTLSKCLSHIGQEASVWDDKSETYIRQPVLGAGIVVGGSLYCIDLDSVIDEHGTIDPTAREIIELMDSYTEVSISGRGIHIFFLCDVGFTKAKVDLDADKTKHREIYGHNFQKFIAITGDVLPGHETIQPRTKEANEAYRLYYKPYELTGCGSSAPRMLSTEKATNTVKDKPKGKGETIESIEAIRNHDYEWFQNALQEPPREFDSSEDFFDFLYSYPLSDFLGVPYKKAFRCPFHEDIRPSASIYQGKTSKGGVWLFHCFSEGLTLNIKEVVLKAGSYRNDVQALEFLKLCLNVKIVDNGWTAKQKALIDGITEFLYQPAGGFSVLCPTAKKVMRSSGKELLNALLMYARNHIIPSSGNQTDEVIFYVSLTDLCAFSWQKDKDKVSQRLKMLCYLGFVKPLQDSDIPTESLKKAREKAEQKGRKWRVSYYQILPLDPERIEGQAVKWRENGYTLKGVSNVMFTLTEGQEVAESLYPQRYEGTGRFGTMTEEGNIQAEQLHQAVCDLAYCLLSEQGYFKQDDIVSLFIEGGYGDRSKAVLQVKRSLPDVCQMYGLKRKKASKALKERFGIESGFPYIYFQEED